MKTVVDKIYKVDGQEYADVCMNNSDKWEPRKVYHRDDGTPYVSIKNPYVSEESGLKGIDLAVAEEFGDRIGDAVRSVFDGYAHTVLMSRMAMGGAVNDPIYILNEDVGETQRTKFINDWAGVRFKWILCMSKGDSFAAPQAITERGDLLTFKEGARIRYYETYEDAMKGIKAYCSEALGYLERIFSEGIEQVSQRINEEYAVKKPSFVVDRLIFDALDEDLTMYRENILEGNISFIAMQRAVED